MAVTGLAPWQGGAVSSLCYTCWLKVDTIGKGSAANTYPWWFYHRQSHMTVGKLPSLVLGLFPPVYTCGTQNLHSPGFGTVKDFTGSSLSPRLLPEGEATRKAVWAPETAAGSVLGLGPKPQAAQMCTLPGSSAKPIRMEPPMQLCPFPSPSKT